MPKVDEREFQNWQSCGRYSWDYNAKWKATLRWDMFAETSDVYEIICDPIPFQSEFWKYRVSVGSIRNQNGFDDMLARAEIMVTKTMARLGLNSA